MTSLFSTPLNILCAFLILKYSQKEMSIYKYYLLLFHSSCSITDLYVSFIATPVAFCPFTIAYGAGIFSSVGVPAKFQYQIGIFLIQLSLITCVNLFLYRLQVILPPDHICKLAKTNYLASFILFLSVQLLLTGWFTLKINIPVQEARQFYKTKYPCLPDELLNHRNVLLVGGFFNPGFKQYTIFVSIDGVLFVIFILMSVWSSFYYLGKSTNVSAITRTLQKKLMIQLLLQVFIPYTVICIPFAVYFIAARNRIANSQTAGDSLCILYSIHGALSSLIIILFNRKYLKTIERAAGRFRSVRLHGCCYLQARQVSDAFSRRHVAPSQEP